MPALWCLVLLLDLVGAPASIPSDRGAVVVSEKQGGAVRWKAQWTMAPGEQDGKRVIRFTEKGNGRYSGFTQAVRWSLDAVWSAGETLQPLDSQKTVQTVSGHLLMTEQKHFDRSQGIVRMERKIPGGRQEIRSVNVTPDTLAVEGIAGILRFLPFGKSMVFPAHVLTNEPSLYSVNFETRGTERIKTPAGEFECYKVEMVPHLGVLDILRPFYPNVFFWFTVEPPHRWVRYEGPENGRGTPEVIMELDVVR